MSSAATYTPRLLPLRLPRVCVAIVGKTPAEMLERAEGVVRDNPFIEFRLDYLRQPSSGFARIKRFLDYHPEVLAIATCRRAKNGGKFHGSVASEIDLLIRAAASGCQLMDLEMESALQLKPKDVERLRTHAALILSFHDFRGTKRLEETFKKMQTVPTDFYKLVTTANRLYDNVLMMKFLEQKSEKNTMVGVCMGEPGIISRVLGVRAGSVFTFGAAAEGEETAVGQISGYTLRNTYRIEQVDAATKVYCVAGDPVAHSLSPLLMNTAFRRENVNAVYLTLHAKTIEDLLACVRDIPIHGISVTMPYKEEILKHLDNTDPVTHKIGACNTVIRGQDGNLYGFNTDVAGVIRPLEQRLQIANAKVLVLGAGGAARAAVFGLKERRAEVYIMNRTAGAGKRLAKQARAKFIGRSMLKKLAFDVIINATPVGMKGGGKSPLKDREVNARIVMDMVYSPAETRFLRVAKARGITTIPGWEMLLHQAARQFEIWTGKPAPLDEMQRILMAALEQQAAAAGKKKK